MKAIIAAGAEHSPEILQLVLFLENAGARKGEALALKWENVDLKNGLIRIWHSDDWQPRSIRPREVPISDALLPYLKGERRSPEYVYPSSTGRPYRYWPKRQFDRARKAAGLKGGPHSLRHSYAILEARPDMRLLAEILGHSDTAVTRLYGHVLPGHLAKAKNVVVFGLDG